MSADHRSVYKIARAIKEHVENACPWSMTFFNFDLDGGAAPELALTTRQKAQVEKYMKEHFYIWANTWIVPLADEILEKHPDYKKEVKP